MRAMFPEPPSDVQLRFDIGARVEAKWRNTEQYSDATIVDYDAQAGRYLSLIHI